MSLILERTHQAIDPNIYTKKENSGNGFNSFIRRTHTSRFNNENNNALDMIKRHEIYPVTRKASDSISKHTFDKKFAIPISEQIKESDLI